LKLQELAQPFIKSLEAKIAQAEVFTEFQGAVVTLDADIRSFHQGLEQEQKTWAQEPATTNDALNTATERLAPLATTSRDLIKQADLAYKLATRLVDHCEKELAAKTNDLWVNRDITKARKDADAARQVAVEQLKQVRYFHKQAVWLTERFPEGKLCDVEGLVALVDRETIAKNDWSLTPGRYVGVAPEEEDEDFDFEEALRDIHVELEGLNQEAVELAAKIAQNFKELGV
jgi:type I restriction enzyme M protein